MGTKTDPGTFDCYGSAEPDEPMFVLLARDKAAPMAVRAWADERERKLRLMGRTDALVDEVLAEVDQIAEARRCADDMDAWRAVHRSDAWRDEEDR